MAAEETVTLQLTVKEANDLFMLGYCLMESETAIRWFDGKPMKDEEVNFLAFWHRHGKALALAGKTGDERAFIESDTRPQLTPEESIEAAKSAVARKNYDPEDMEDETLRAMNELLRIVENPKDRAAIQAEYDKRREELANKALEEHLTT